ncbi:MerR family transcriptional regulator [Cohnella sp. CFH 77786]|nr:MerR family transcriptional regulator [Cohnella sp. CFH 77786]MBW5446354.1 MerR family transcriptional regulator [Cohnella sp. CFH 77786]
MRIQELARKLNLSQRAIRFYEEKGMIRPRKNPDTRYRSFGEADARRLQTIMSLREIGMPVEEIKALLDELDRGKRDEVLHALELQRSMMFSQFVELKHNMHTADRIIERMKKEEEFVWEDIYELTRGLRRLRELRSAWRDHWDFDGQAPLHDELVRDGGQPFNAHPAYDAALRLIAEWTNPRKAEQGLDIGTGTGNLAGLFLDRGIEMSAIDQSIGMLKQCQRKFPSLDTKLGNFLAIPYMDHTFDFAVSSYAMHHLTDDQKLLALDEMRRVLKPHGRVCFADLMFVNEEKRSSYLRKLEAKGKTDIVARIESEYYADRSRILQWFDDYDYVTKVRQLTDLLHIVYAVPSRMAY